jgi:hypothetical protein
MAIINLANGSLFGTIRSAINSMMAELYASVVSLTTGVTNAQNSATSAATTAAAAIPGAAKGTASGVATLDVNAKVPLAQITGVLALANLSDGAAQASAIAAKQPITGIASVEAADRALVVADNGKNLICATLRTFMVNTGMGAGWGVAAKGPVTFSQGSGVTVTDVRTTGATNPWCTLMQTNAAGTTYDVVGSKA